MSRHPQSQRTLKFRADADGARCVELTPGKPGFYIVVHATPRYGYAWIGSDKESCVGHIPLTTLKRIVDQAYYGQRPDGRKRRVP